MLLDNLKSAWAHHKLINSMEQLESEEILSIIKQPEFGSTIKFRRVLINLAVFIAITLCCQGG